jgi:hypothetical protein
MSHHANSIESTIRGPEAGDEEDDDRVEALEQEDEDLEDEDVNEAAANEEVKTNDPRE